MGSLRHIDFGVFWASWGRSGKEPVPETIPSFDGFREDVVRGCDGFRQVLGHQARFWELVPVSMGEVLRRFQVPEIAFFPSCRGFEGFGGSGFRCVPRFGQWLRFRRFWSSRFLMGF